MNNICVKKQQVFYFFSCSFAAAEICAEIDFCECFQFTELPIEKIFEGSVLAWLCEDLQTVRWTIPNALRHLVFLPTIVSKGAENTFFQLMFFFHSLQSCVLWKIAWYVT